MDKASLSSDTSKPDFEWHIHMRVLRPSRFQLSGSRWMRAIVASKAESRLEDKELRASSIAPAVGFVKTVRKWRTANKNL